jgi:RNA polymerase sigma factor (sigma-70 family)
VNEVDSNAAGPVGPEVLGRLVDRHAAALELYARQLCCCPQDVVQEALVQLAGLRQAPRDVAAWLYAVVRNRALSASRSARRRKRHEGEAAGRRAAWFVPTTADAIDAQAATAALESLPEECREVVVARVWGGLTFQQIGRMTGTSDSTAERRYEAALTLLREKLRIPWVQND